jgi:hypothetical protein
VDEVKALCRDFSSRTGNVYIKDVESALDGLAALPSADPTYPASQERADAGKDAALKQALDALKQGKQFIVNGVEFGFIRMPEPGDPALYTLPTINAAIDAILAANKETPERAEPRALTDARAKEIAQQVHAECSRIPGATFYNAAMSAIEQAVKERK